MKKIMATERGFTMVEILFVITIIGVLLMILLPRVSFAANRARETGVKNDFHMLQTSTESYLREAVGVNLTESGLNDYLDKSVKVSSGLSALKDPWGNPYKISIKNTSSSEKLLIARSSGADGLSNSPSDITNFTGSSYDADDKVLGVYYKNGNTTSCTTGFSTNIGSMNISGPNAVAPLGAVDIDVPLTMRQTMQASYAYEYAVDATIETIDHVIYTTRSYIYSNVPLILSIESVTTYQDKYGTMFDKYTRVKEANNRTYAGFSVWSDYYSGYDSNNHNDVYTTYSATPYTFTNSELATVYETEDVDYWSSKITAITDVTGGVAPPNTILGCK